MVNNCYNSGAVSVQYSRGMFSVQSSSSSGKGSVEFQSNFGSVLGQFQSNFRAVLPLFLEGCFEVDFQSNFRAVPEQRELPSDYRAVSEQLPSNFRAFGCFFEDFFSSST